MRNQTAAIAIVVLLTLSIFTALTATSVAVATAPGTPTVEKVIATTTSITSSKTSPKVNEKAIFTITLKAGSIGLSKPVKIWHTTNGVRYENGMHNTVNGVYKFTQAFGSKGQRIYHSEFAGSCRYGASVGTVTVNVKVPTTITISASKTNPLVYEMVTYTVTLKAGSTGLSKMVKIWHIKNGVRYEDGLIKTTNGVYSTRVIFLSKGQFIFHVDFAGDREYRASTAFFTFNVQ